MFYILKNIEVANQNFKRADMEIPNKCIKIAMIKGSIYEYLKKKSTEEYFKILRMHRNFSIDSMNFTCN